MPVLRLIPYELKKLFFARFVYLFLAALLVVHIFLCSFLAKDSVTDETLLELPKLKEYVDKVYDMYLEDPEFILSEYERIMALPENTSFSYGEKGYPDEAIFEHFYKIVSKDEVYHKRVSQMVLQTTGRGRAALFWRKLTLNLFTVAFVFVLFRAIDLYYLLQNYKLPDLSANLFSITRFASAPPSMSIMVYTVLTTLLSFAGVLLLSMLIFVCTIYLKKTILTYAVLSAGLFIPHFIVQTGGWLGNYIDFTQLYDTHRLYLHSINHKPTLYIFFFAILCIAILSMLFYSLRKIQKGGKV